MSLGFWALLFVRALVFFNGIFLKDSTVFECVVFIQELSFFKLALPW